LAALVGEQSDNLPGVPKVGKKTAAKWINQYGSLDVLVAHQSDIPGVVGRNLRDHIDQVLLNRRLNELRRDLPLAVDAESLLLGPINRQELDLLLDSLQFTKIRKRILQSAVWPHEGSEPDADDRQGELRSVVLGVGGLASFLASVGSATVGSATVGLEVNGRLYPGSGDAASVAIALADNRVTVIDLLALEETDDLALMAWLEDPQAPKAVHGSKSAIRMLQGRGIDLRGVAFDTEIAAYLIWPDQRGYSLPELSEQLLGDKVGQSQAVVQGTLDLEPADALAVAAHRAAAAVRLVEPLTEELRDRQASWLLVELEQPLTAVLAAMERAGVAIDEERLRDLRSQLAGRVELAEREAIAALGGRTVNLGSPKALQEVLFTELKMPKTRRTKTGYSTDATSLAELFRVRPHPFLAHLLAHRDAIKLRQMVDGLLATIQEDGRIHTTFSQTVAATGRLSSSDPNLQNIPTRSEIGRELRHCFVVGTGFAELMTADYSQIEMRIMADLSGDPGLIEAFNGGEDLHRTVAAKVFGVAAADVSAEQRSKIKAVSYGLAYGLSAYGLSRQLGIEQSAAEKLRKDYFDRFGGVQRYLESVVRQARKDGYTQTIFGRRRYLPDLTSTNRIRREMAERMALNAPIQGSAADIIKLAMLKTQAALEDEGLKSRLILQVHDELIVEVAKSESQAVEELLRREMGGAAKLKVPLTVSVGRGASWREAGH
jgi:DNA polymerase-1